MQNPLLPVPHAAGQFPQHQPGAGLLAADVDRLRRSLDQSVSENTRAAYAYAWRSFQAWAGARAALALPASPPLVAAYLSHLAEDRRLSVATVRLHKAALAAVHKAAGHDDPTDRHLAINPMVAVFSAATFSPGVICHPGQERVDCPEAGGKQMVVSLPPRRRPVDPAVFSYARVSQAEGENGLATQRRILNAHGLRDDRIFTDIASGRHGSNGAAVIPLGRVEPSGAVFRFGDGVVDPDQGNSSGL